MSTHNRKKLRRQQFGAFSVCSADSAERKDRLSPQSFLVCCLFQAVSGLILYQNGVPWSTFFFAYLLVLERVDIKKGTIAIMRQSLFFVIRGETRIERRRKPEKGSGGAFSARRDSGASSLVLGKKTEVPIGASVFFANSSLFHTFFLFFRFVLSNNRFVESLNHKNRKKV